MPWSWMGLPFPGDQTRTSYRHRMGISLGGRESARVRRGMRDGLFTHQITLAVSLVDEVSGIAATGVTEGILGPFQGVVLIVGHEALEIFDIDIVRGQARRRAKRFLEGEDELVEAVVEGVCGRADAGAEIVLDADGHRAGSDDVDGHDVARDTTKRDVKC